MIYENSKSFDGNFRHIKGIRSVASLELFSTALKLVMTVDDVDVTILIKQRCH